MKKILTIAVIIFISNKLIYSQSKLKNSIGVRLGFVSWDGIGTDFSDFYELQYSYQVSQKISLIGKFNTGCRSTSLDYYDEKEKEQFLNSKFVAKDNTSNTPDIFYSGFHSYGVGLKYRINSDIKSSIQMYLGARQVYINEKKYSSLSRIRNLNIKDRFISKIRLGWELGLSYDYRLTDIISLSSSAHFVSNSFLWEINIGSNIWF